MALMAAMTNSKNNSSQKTKKIKGQYANCFQIGQNEFEILIDFGQSYSENGEENFHTRIVCNPFYANVLLELLKVSIKRHEVDFGSTTEGI